MRIEELLMAQARRTPRGRAVTDGRYSWSYEELAQQVRERAEELRRQGVQAGQVFALRGKNSTLWLREALAALACGGILMPLHPEWTTEEQQRLFAQVSPEWQAELQAGEEPEVKLRRREGTADRQGWPEMTEQQRQDLFFLGFTSGSTGWPKGLLKTHLSWTASFEGWTRSFGLQHSDRILLPLPLSYSAQLYAAFHALSIGAEVLLLPRFSPAGFFRAGATCAVITPALIRPLVQYRERLEGEGSGEMAMPARVISVGSKMAVAQRRRFEQLFPESRLYEYYGSTEMGYVSLVRPEDAREAPETVGRPFPGVEVAVLDQSGQPLPAGEAGMLYVRSPQAFVGYVGRAEETAASFRGEWVTARDMGLIREDGRILLLGREREVIKAGGSMVWAREVEEVLLSCPGVEDAAVVAGEEEGRGEVVWAAVVLREGTGLSRVRRWCRSRLAPYKQPRRWQAYAQLPQNKNGKVDKPLIQRQMARDYRRV